MSYEILLTDQGLEIIHLTGVTFKSLATWCIQFDDGKEAVVCNSSEGWTQCDGDRLNTHKLIAIGKCINDAMIKKNPGTTDNYFYDILLSEEV